MFMQRGETVALGVGPARATTKRAGGGPLILDDAELEKVVKAQPAKRPRAAPAAAPPKRPASTRGRARLVNDSEEEDGGDHDGGGGGGGGEEEEEEEVEEGGGIGERSDDELLEEEARVEEEMYRRRGGGAASASAAAAAGAGGEAAKAKKLLPPKAPPAASATAPPGAADVGAFTTALGLQQAPPRQPLQKKKGGAGAAAAAAAAAVVPPPTSTTTTTTTTPAPFTVRPDGTIELSDGRLVLPNGMVLAPISGYEEERGRLEEELAIQVGLAEEERFAAWLQYMALRGVAEEGLRREAAKRERQQQKVGSYNKKRDPSEDTLPSTIPRLEEAPLAALLAQLYPRWKCKVSGLRAGTQDELRGVVGASKASADATLAREGAPTPFTLTQLKAAFLRGEGELERRVGGMGRVVARRGGEEGAGAVASATLWSRAWMVDFGVVNEEAVERTVVGVEEKEEEMKEEEEEEEEKKEKVEKKLEEMEVDVGIELDE